MCQVTCQLIDFSESKLLSSAYEENHNLFQVFKFLPYVPFLIDLFTHDSYWIERLSCEDYSFVFRFLKKIPNWLLTRKEFWVKAFTTRNIKSRNNLRPFIIQTIQRLDQLDSKDIELVKQIAINAIELVEQRSIEQGIEFRKKIQENEELLLNHDFVLEGLMNNYLAKEDVHESLLRDGDFVIRMAELIQHYYVIASSELLQDMDYLKRLIKVCPMALTNDKRRESKELLIEALTSGYPIYYIGDIEPWENDEDVVLKAVEMDDYVIKELSDKFLTDDKFLMKAVLANGMNYKYHSHLLKGYIQNLDEFEIGLVVKRGRCINVIDPKFKSTEELEKLVEINPFVLDYIPNNYERSLLKKAATVLIQQFKTIERNGGKTDCVDWKDLLYHLYKRPEMDEMANKIYVYEYKR